MSNKKNYLVNRNMVDIINKEAATRYGYAALDQLEMNLQEMISHQALEHAEAVAADAIRRHERTPEGDPMYRKILENFADFLDSKTRERRHF